MQVHYLCVDYLQGTAAVVKNNNNFKYNRINQIYHIDHQIIHKIITIYCKIMVVILMAILQLVLCLIKLHLLFQGQVQVVIDRMYVNQNIIHLNIVNRMC